MTVLVAATINAMGFSTINTFNIVDFIVRYHVASDVLLLGPVDGEFAVSADLSQNETQINLQVRTAIAAYLNTVLTPNPGLAAVDIKGCNL